MIKITLRRDYQTVAVNGVVQDKHAYAQCQWRFGEKLDKIAHQEMMQKGYLPVAVEVSGEERDWVGRNFSGIPRVSVGVLTESEKWRGDFAAFIYDHLPRVFVGIRERRVLDSF